MSESLQKGLFQQLSIAVLKFVNKHCMLSSYTVSNKLVKIPVPCHPSPVSSNFKTQCKGYDLEGTFSITKIRRHAY